MKTLLLSTALLGVTAVAAHAQDIFRPGADPLELRASDLIGMRVYASEAAVEADEYAGAQEGWEDIGEINDLVVARDGSAQAVLVDIGGFLGMGERQVAVNMGAIRFVSDSATADDAGDFFLVLNTPRAALEEAPAYGADAMAEGAQAESDAALAEAATETSTETEMEADATVAAATGEMAADETAATDEAAVTTDTEMADTAAGDAAAGDAAAEDMAAAEPAADAMATDDAMAADATTDDAMADDAMAADAMTEDAATGETVAEAPADGTTLARTPLTREGYLAAEADYLTAEKLQGAAVYDANDERVGEVAELVLSAEGQITDVVVDVGGFLGIGEKPVAMKMGEIDILRQEGGEDVRVYVSQSREALEAMPNYEP